MKKLKMTKNKEQDYWMNHIIAPWGLGIVITVNLCMLFKIGLDILKTYFVAL